MQAQVFASHHECQATPDVEAPLPESAVTSFDRAGVRKARKREMSKFSKRRKTFIKRANDLSRDCNSRVFVVIQKNNRFHVYTSEPGNQNWPPSHNDIVGIWSRVKSTMADGSTDASLPTSKHFFTIQLCGGRYSWSRCKRARAFKCFNCVTLL